MMNTNDHSDLLSLLKSGESKSFDIIYDRFADHLFDFICSRIRNKAVSEEILQEIFISLWRKRETLEITRTLEAYLFGSAKHKILTYIRSERVHRKYAEDFVLFAAQHYDNSNEEMMDVKDLQHCIDLKISQLPEKCRLAFRLSRVDHQPIQQIAERMNISKRTVENYLSQALKHLRTSMSEYLPVLILWISVH